MGTRAVISFGNTRIFTHWDGNPECLGRELATLEKPTWQDVVGVATRYTIDSATPDVLKVVSWQRYERIAEKANSAPNRTRIYTPEDIHELDAQGKELGFGIMGPEDHAVGAWRPSDAHYAEYEYQVLPSGVVQYRAGDDSNEWITIPRNSESKTDA